MPPSRPARGWTLTPAGKHVELTDLPLNIIPLGDGKHTLVTCNGCNAHQLSLIDLAEPRIVDQLTVRQSWFGLALAPASGNIWWSGGGAGMLHSFALADSKLKRTSPNEPEPGKGKKKDQVKLKTGSSRCARGQWPPPRMRRPSGWRPGGGQLQAL
jgi:hypothetical protein